MPSKCLSRKTYVGEYYTAYDTLWNIPLEILYDTLGNIPRQIL